METLPVADIFGTLGLPMLVVFSVLIEVLYEWATGDEPEASSTVLGFIANKSDKMFFEPEPLDTLWYQRMRKPENAFTKV